MTSNNGDVFVVQHPEGWAVRKRNSLRASAVTATQKEAVHRAKKAAGKGSVRVQGKDGKFKAK
jgi:hypothetical protein